MWLCTSIWCFCIKSGGGGGGRVCNLPFSIVRMRNIEYLKELCHEIHENSNSGERHKAEWNFKITGQNLERYNW